MFTYNLEISYSVAWFQKISMLTLAKDGHWKLQREGDQKTKTFKGIYIRESRVKEGGGGWVASSYRVFLKK